jgi:hypothetical protein
MRLKRLTLPSVMALMMLLSVVLVDGGQSAFAQDGPGESPGCNILGGDGGEGSDGGDGG